MTRTEPSRYRRAAASSFRKRSPGPLRGTRPAADGGFTLIETLISTFILTIGMVAIAAMLAVTTQMQIGAREAARSTRLAQDKIDELMKLDFEDDPEVALGGDLDADVVNYSETPLDGITLRWAVDEGPTGAGGDTRILTVRVVNLRAQQYRQTDMATIIREW